MVLKRIRSLSATGVTAERDSSVGTHLHEGDKRTTMNKSMVATIVVGAAT